MSQTGCKALHYAKEKAENMLTLTFPIKHQCQDGTSSIVDNNIRQTCLLPSVFRQQTVFTNCSIVLSPILGGSPPQTSFAVTFTAQSSQTHTNPIASLFCRVEHGVSP